MSMSTMSAAAAPALSLDQQYHQNHNQQQQQQQLVPPPPPPPSSNSEQLCYVHCNICDTVLAVSVPSASLFKTVTVRCGHCTNLLPVNMRALIQLPPPPTSPSAIVATGSPFNFPHPYFSPTTPPHNTLLFDEIQSPGVAATQPPPPANLLMFNPHQLNSSVNNNHDYFGFNSARGGGGLQVSSDELSRPPPLVVNRPPEKRQRVPSAYNRFIKEEIQRIKAENPDIAHREAFSAAAKNWAHFPHIHFGLMPDQPLKKTTKTTLIHPHPEAEDQHHRVLTQDGFFGSANVGIAGTLLTDHHRRVKS